MERYKDECQMLAYLAKRQLNLTKNAVKEDFEDLHIYEIFELLKSEVNEIEDALDSKERGNKYFEHLLSEIGDIAGCAVGLIAKINQIQKGIK